MVGLKGGIAPNMRVQRTRSSPSALRSPLTRHPLGATDGIGRAARRLVEAPSVAASGAGRMVRGVRFRMVERGVIGKEFCAPRASAMRADERGEGAESQLGGSSRSATLQESARPPAESAPLWRARGGIEDNPNRAPAGATRGRGQR